MPENDCNFSNFQKIPSDLELAPSKHTIVILSS